MRILWTIFSKLLSYFKNIPNVRISVIQIIGDMWKIEGNYVYKICSTILLNKMFYVIWVYDMQNKFSIVLSYDLSIFFSYSYFLGIVLILLFSP